MAKSKHKDIGESASKGTARRTLTAARFFLDQAGRLEHHIEYHSYYVEAAIVFTWMVWDHLGKEFGKKPEAKQWIKNQRKNRSALIRDLETQRNLLSHEHPIGIVLSQREGVSSPVYERLPDQLDEIETIVRRM